MRDMDIFKCPEASFLSCRCLCSQSIYLLQGNVETVVHVINSLFSIQNARFIIEFTACCCHGRSERSNTTTLEGWANCATETSRGIAGDTKILSDAFSTAMCSVYQAQRCMPATHVCEITRLTIWSNHFIQPLGRASCSFMLCT